MIGALQRKLVRFGKLARLLTRRQFRKGLRNGVAAAVEHYGLLRNVPLDTLIDVGANVGQFSLLIRTLNPKARIYAFEPLSRPAKKFERLFSDDFNVVLHRIAIGAQSADATMFVANRADNSSLLPITNRQTRSSGTFSVGTEKVTVRRLDEIFDAADIARPSCLKLDVQGYELSVLQGCISLLDQIDLIYVEVSFLVLYEGQALADEIIQFLFAQGFSLRAVNHPTYDRSGQCLQADLLFDRRS